MSTMPLLKAKLKENIRKEATSLPVAMEAQTKTRTRQLALRAVNGDINELDLANLDALGRITGQLKNTYIESVSAAKITSATMLSTALTLAGTDASGNKSRLTMTGDALLQTDPADEGAVPTNMAGRGIFNTGPRFAGLWFYDNTGQRGMQMRSDGVPGGKNGRITFISTAASQYGPTDVGSYANLILTSSPLAFTNMGNQAGVSMRNALSVIGPMRSTGSIETDNALFTKGNANVGGALVADGNAVLKAALAVSGLTTLQGVDATNIRASGQYNNTGNTAAFGGGIELGGSLSMRGYQRINAAAYSGITSVASGATVTLPYPGGNDPLWVEVRGRPVGSTWRAATASGATTGASNNAWNANGVSVTNHNGVSVEVQAIFWA